MSKALVVLLTIFELCYGAPKDNILTKLESRLPVVPPATPEDAPYQIYLWHPNMGDDNLFYGGTILSSKTILTSAIFIDALVVNETLVIAGANIRDSTGYPYLVSEVLTNPNFNNDTENAIVLLYVDRNIYFNDQIQPVQVGFFDVTPGTIVTLSGWTYFEGSDWYNDELRVIHLPTISKEECEDELPGMLENSLCTFSSRSEGACLGDFGGPLVYENYVVGIQFLGFYACLGDKPDVYIEVSPYHDWIIQNLK